MLTRRALAVALATSAAALTALPAVPAAASDAQMCRIVFDPFQVWTPVGVIQVPRPYCVSP